VADAKQATRGWGAGPARSSPAAAISTRLMPTSITVAPSPTQSPRIISGRPTAATRISAERQSAGRSVLREWAIVTVQSAASSKAASGLPTMLERPTTTARLPRSSPSVSRSRIMQPLGVHGSRRSSGIPPEAENSRPTLSGWKPSTSLAGWIASSTRLASTWPGSGSWTRMPWTSAAALSSAMTASSSVVVAVSGSSSRRPFIPAASAMRVLVPT
jgi:hypothetical protein